MRKTENFTHQIRKINPKLALDNPFVIYNYSASLHSIIIRQVNLRRVFRPLISTSCF